MKTNIMEYERIFANLIRDNIIIENYKGATEYLVALDKLTFKKRYDNNYNDIFINNYYEENIYYIEKLFTAIINYRKKESLYYVNLIVNNNKRIVEYIMECLN